MISPDAFSLRLLLISKAAAAIISSITVFTCSLVKSSKGSSSFITDISIIWVTDIKHGTGLVGDFLIIFPAGHFPSIVPKVRNGRWIDVRNYRLYFLSFS